MKRIFLLLLALTCFAAVRANQYSLSLPYPYVEAITSPSSESYIYIDPKGGSATLYYRFPQTTYTSDQLRSELNRLINVQGISSWVSVSSVSVDLQTRTGYITFYLSANFTDITRSLQIKAGSTYVTCLQLSSYPTLSPSSLTAIPGERFEMLLDASKSGYRYELQRNGTKVDYKIGTGSKLSFTQTAPLYIGTASDYYTVNSSSAVNGSCTVNYPDLIVRKLIRWPSKTIPVAQQGGSVTVRCTWDTGNDNSKIISDLMNIANKMHNRYSVYWDTSRVSISTGNYSYDERYCELKFNFTPNNTDYPISCYSLFLFDAEGSLVEFVQEGIDRSSEAANWIRTRTYTSPADAQYREQTVYYDGLGRTEQTVQKGASPTGQDIVTMVEYDSFGRESRQWLPVALTGRGSRQDPTSIRTAAQSLYDGDPIPYTETFYEPSPLNRAQENWNTGQVMRDNDAKTSTKYARSDAGEVLAAHVDANGALVIAAATDTAGKFYKQVSTDADGCITQNFTDMDDKQVLTRIIAGSIVCDTYYFYDVQDRLRWVISPEGARQLQAGHTYTESDEFIEQYGYIYHYDTRGRVVSKRMPGAAFESFVYNDADQVIAHQDGNSAAEIRWAISEYDAHKRLLWDGIISDKSRSDIENTYASARSLEALRGESSFRLMRQCWYGQMPDNADNGLSFYTPGSNWPNNDSRTRDRKVYEKITVLSPVDDEEDMYIHRAFFYDKQGRLIQTAERNLLGEVSWYSTRYDFTGNILEQREWHAGENYAGLNQSFTYDNQGRKLSATARLNDQPASVSYLYDPVGRLGATAYGSGEDKIVDSKTYNVQGWVKATRNPLFRSELHYYDPAHRTTKPSFTGNISEWAWTHSGDGGSGQENRYAFSYDGLSRLTKTEQYQDNMPNRQNVETGINYDRNGNIMALKRYATGTLSDDFLFTYSGNQLTTLNDAGTNYGYTYDANGNTYHDGLHDFELRYNHINLLEKVWQWGNNLANYSYLADGTKLAATDNLGDGLVYLGSLVYRKLGHGLVLESAAFEGGRFIANGTTPQPNYFITDHLGSVRVVVNAEGAVLERNDYYPFGKRWDEGLIFGYNRHRYNAKEEQGFLNLPYNDYGARMADPTIGGRWITPDPLMEITPEVGSAVFCQNNPINNIDPTGLFSQPAGADSTQVVPIAPVTVEAPRLNPIGKTLAFIMWSVAGWGELLNGASGSTNTSFSQNMQTGMDFWSSMALGYGLSKLNISSSKIKRSKNIKISSKIQGQMTRRGWTEKAIRETINTPFTTRTATNRATNNAATAYFNKDGSYIVVDNVTNEIVQISNSVDKNWIPDATIINPYKPN